MLERELDRAFERFLKGDFGLPAKFFTFTLFFAIFGYFLVASGPYVDAKYRMPAVALIEIIALYGVVAIWNRLLVLRFIRK